MEEFFILAFIMIFFIIILMALSIKVVSQSDIWVVERLGKYHTTLNAGFHIIVPIIDLVRRKLTAREQVIDIPKQNVITKDNVNIAIDGIVFFKIEDASAATYNVIDYEDAITNLAMTTLRGEIGSMMLDDTLSSRDKINAQLQTAISEAADNWGIKIMRIEVSEISVPSNIEAAMNLQMEAEREKRAIELKAQAQKEALIRNAEANKQEQVLKAEAIERMADAKKYEQIATATGEKNAIEMINDAMSKNKVAAEFLLAKERISAWQNLAMSKGDKIVIPFETAELLGSISVLKDFLKKDE